MLSVTAVEMTAEEFKNLRVALGISQRKFAKILGVAHMTIIRAEQRGPTRALESYLQLALQKGLLNIAEKTSKPDKRSDK